MAKFVHKRLGVKEQDELLEELCEVLQLLKAPKEKMYFLKDLLGRGERVMLARRFKIAKFLEEGMIYQEIINLMRVSPGTIARVERLLNFGRSGYRNAIAKIRNKK